MTPIQTICEPRHRGRWRTTPSMPRGRMPNGASDLEDVASLPNSRTKRSVMMSKLYGAPTRLTGPGTA
jgi:hypothetical protein